MDTQLNVIKCPGCGQALPPTAVRCQFCGADTSKVVRPVMPQKKVERMNYGTPQWVWPAYYVVSGWYLVSGLWDILNGLGAFDPKHTMRTGTLILGAITATIGIGLLAKFEPVRGIVNVFCFVRMFFAILGGLGSLAVMTAFPALGFIGLVFSILDFCLSGFMVYLIGETD